MKKRSLPTIVLLVLVALVLAACGGGDFASDAEPERARPAPDSAPAASEPEAPSNEIFQEAGDAGPSSDFLFPILTPGDAGDRRLVYTLNARLQTTDFSGGMLTLNEAVRAAGGYTVHADVHGSDLHRETERSGNFRFRVPTEELGPLIIVLENNFNILSLQQEMVEVTTEYRDTTWDLDDLREEEAQLQEALETAEGDAYAWTADRLREVQRAIRELTAAQAELLDDVVYSTVDIQLFEAFVPEDVPPSMWGPVIVIIGALVLVGIIVIFVLLAKRSSKNEDTPA